MSWRKWATNFGLMIVLLVPCEASSLSGVVQDASGSPVTGARIILSLPGSPTESSSQVTGASGEFTFLDLAPATYDLAVEARGFMPWRRTGFQIGTTGDVRLPPIAIQITGGCGFGEPPPTRVRLIWMAIKHFFVPIDWSKVEICQ